MAAEKLCLLMVRMIQASFFPIKDYDSCGVDFSVLLSFSIMDLSRLFLARLMNYLDYVLLLFSRLLAIFDLTYPEGQSFHMFLQALPEAIFPT